MVMVWFEKKFPPMFSYTQENQHNQRSLNESPKIKIHFVPNEIFRTKSKLL
jgi:hypothetical protein